MTRFPYHTLYCQVRGGGFQKGVVINHQRGDLLKSLSQGSKDTDPPLNLGLQTLTLPKT